MEEVTRFLAPGWRICQVPGDPSSIRAKALKRLKWPTTATSTQKLQHQCVRDVPRAAGRMDVSVSPGPTLISCVCDLGKQQACPGSRFLPHGARVIITAGWKGFVRSELIHAEKLEEDELLGERRWGTFILIY